MRYFLFCLLVISCRYSIAQPSFPPPAGVYCSCGPTTGNGWGSVNPSVAAKPYVKGILVRVGWDILEPTDGNYNWALIDTQVNRAKQYGKKVSLGIGCGIHIPQWVFDSGAQRLVSSMPFNDTLAVPWDSYYLSKWKEMITDLGSRYINDTTIQLVYMTHSTANGFEMQLPMSVSPTLSAIGYTDKKMADSWKEVIDAFSTAFPNHYLSNDFHPVNGSNAVADTVYKYAATTVGQRYGAAAWWWTQKNTGVYPAQYSIMKNSVDSNVFSAVQFAKSGTKDSAAFGAGGMPGALQLAINDGICYWEVWNDDILNPDFDTLLSSATCNTVSVEETAVYTNHDVQVYPNPSDGTFNLQLPEQNAVVTITGINGKLIKRIVAKQEKNIILELSDAQKGIYLVHIKDEHNSFYKKLLLK